MNLNLQNEPKLDNQSILVKVGDLKHVLRHALSLETAIEEARNRPQQFHKGRQSTYAVHGKVTVQTNHAIYDMAELVLYQADEDGSFWARPATEMEDPNRFREFNHERADEEYTMQASVTVGGGHMVFGTVEAIGRVQTALLIDSTHPVEASDTTRILQRKLTDTENEIVRLTDLLRQNAKTMANS